MTRASPFFARLRLLTRIRTEYRALWRRVEELGGEIEELRSALVDLAELPFHTGGEALLRARREVTEHAGPGEYVSHYRSEELLYWLHLPRWIEAWSRESHPRHIVDIGAGYGALAVFAALTTKARVSCLEIDPARLSPGLIAAHHLDVVQGNVESSSLPWRDVDAVLMTEVIEHFNFRPTPTMRKIHDAMTPGGRLFLSTPDAVSWGRVDGPYVDYRDMPEPDPNAPTVDRHVYQFTSAELTEVLEDAGFHILRLARAPGRWGFHLDVEAERGE